MCRTILKRVELLNFVIAYRNLHDKFSTDFLMFFHYKKGNVLSQQSISTSFHCLCVYLHASVAVDLNFILISPSKTRLISI